MQKPQQSISRALSLDLKMRKVAKKDKCKDSSDPGFCSIVNTVLVSSQVGLLSV